MKTETEFRKNLAQRLGLVNWKSGTSHVVDRAVVAVLESGLEFAPEPVQIPSCLGVSDSGKIVDASVNALLAYAELAEICKRAMAYPGLYCAAQALLGRLRALGVQGAGGYIGSLESELEKGPRP